MNKKRVRSRAIHCASYIISDQIEDVSHARERKQLATVRLRGLVSATGKLITRWSDLKHTPTF